MRLFVKNKFFSFGGSSFVLDENQNKIFKVKGKIFSPTRKKKIYDMEGDLKYIVRNKFWKLFKTSTLIYDSDHDLIAKLSNSDWDFKNKFVLEGDTDDITISGNLIQFPNIKLQVTKNDKLIGTITKDFNLFRDSFSIDVNEMDDAAFLVALVISIDNIWDNRSRK